MPTEYKENPMKRLMVALFAMILTACPAMPMQDKDWETNFKLASAKAEKGSRYLLLNFSGSDWCVWCNKLDSEVFNNTEFKKYARDNLVCVLLDFPVTKPQNMDLKKQNAALAGKYEVSGYPTLVILNSKGDLINKTGYLAGGAKKYVEHLKTIISEYEKKKGSGIS
jgi:protein disulfide-isomerase